MRIPASLCSVVGLKPTYGSISRYGVMTESWSLDHVGPMAKTVEDLKILFQAAQGYDEKDRSSVPNSVYSNHVPMELKRSKIGIISEYVNSDRLDGEVRRLFESACGILEGECQIIEEVSVPWIDTAKAPTFVIAAADAVSNLWSLVKDRLIDLTHDVRVFLEFGKLIIAEDYLRAQKMRSFVIEEMGKLFGRYDLLVNPTTPAFASSIITTGREEEEKEGAREHLTEFTTPFNLTGYPAISVPCGFGSSGLPAGLQIAARPFEEQLLFEAGWNYEQKTDWHKRRPNV